MTLTDSNKKHKVTTRLIFDLDFFFSFFGNPIFTHSNIAEKALAVCEKWNYKYAGKPEVRIIKIAQKFIFWGQFLELIKQKLLP